MKKQVHLTLQQICCLLIPGIKPHTSVLPLSVLTQVFLLTISPCPYQVLYYLADHFSFHPGESVSLVPCMASGFSQHCLTGLWLAFVTCKQEAISRSLCFLTSLSLSRCLWLGHPSSRFTCEGLTVLIASYSSISLPYIHYRRGLFNTHYYLWTSLPDCQSPVNKTDPSSPQVIWLQGSQGLSLVLHLHLLSVCVMVESDSPGTWERAFVVFPCGILVIRCCLLLS